MKDLLLKLWGWVLGVPTYRFYLTEQDRVVRRLAARPFAEARQHGHCPVCLGEASHGTHGMHCPTCGVMGLP
jgi:hypothetical protein